MNHFLNAVWLGILLAQASRGSESWSEAKISVMNGERISSSEVIEKGTARREEIQNSGQTPQQISQEIAAEMIDFIAAKALAEEGKLEESFKHLVAEDRAQMAAGKTLLQESANRDSLASEAFELHAKILGEVNRNEDVPGLGYHYATGGDSGGLQAIFAYAGDPNDERMFKIGGMSDDERKYMIIGFSAAEDPTGGMQKMLYLQAVAKPGEFGLRLVNPKSVPPEFELDGCRLVLQFDESMEEIVSREVRSPFRFQAAGWKVLSGGSLVDAVKAAKPDPNVPGVQAPVLAAAKNHPFQGVWIWGALAAVGLLSGVCAARSRRRSYRE